MLMALCPRAYVQIIISFIDSDSTTQKARLAKKLILTELTTLLFE